MTTLAPEISPMTATGPLRRIGAALSDTTAIAGRNLRALVRVPQLIVFSAVQPVIFVLLFRYVFGGAINVPGVPYVDFLFAGIFAQVVTFGAMGTAVGLAADVNMGFLERFRSLPMADTAVLAGRTLADLARNVCVVALMTGVAFLVGYRVQTGALGLLAALGLMLLFGYALSWALATVGLAVANPETAQAACVPVLFMLVFASSAFVPIASMPGWLQPFAQHQPITAEVNAVRALTLGGPVAAHVWPALVWTAGILALAAPLAVWRYRKTA